jgi:hypothetical protein
MPAGQVIHLVKELAAREPVAALRKLKNLIDFLAHFEPPLMPQVAAVASAPMAAAVV